MKKLILICVLAACSFAVSAQQMHESFKKEPQLMQAIKSYDFTALAADVVVFEFDTIQREATPIELNQLIKQYVVIGKQQTMRKAAEANNGYIQTMGIYTKNDDALLYIKFEFDPLTSKLIEVVLNRN
jgi:hypothetical protein